MWGGGDLREVSVYYAGEENISVSIGNNCLISTVVHIRASDGHTIYSAINPKEILNASSKCIKIGNHVWVGQNALITKDVIIPNNCVVGMGGSCYAEEFFGKFCYRSQSSKNCENQYKLGCSKHS